jgi:hypothetical protein
MRAKHTEKCKYRQKNIFSRDVPLEKYTQEYNVFLCVHSQKQFFYGSHTPEKLVSPRLKINFLCVNPHRKKEKPTEKSFFS